MDMRISRKIAALLAVLLILTARLTAFASPADYDKTTPAVLRDDHLYGESTVVVDGDTGEILFSKNSRIRMYPASTTKVMTLLLAVESGVSFDTPVTVPPEAADVPNDSSLVPIYKGEVTTFGDLLYGLMLHSGNDAANAIAVLLEGSIEGFVAKMNERASQLGCVGTHFVNAHGYHNENHYSTAQDLALITREALKHEEIREIVATNSYTMNISPRGEVPLSSKTSLMMPNSSYYYAECIGVKTGTHSRAGKCFIGAAEKDGVLLITVTLNCAEDNQKWVDSIRMFNYGFTCYTPYTLEQMFDLTSSRIATVQISNAHKDDPMAGVLALDIAQVSNLGYERMVQTDNESAMAKAMDDFVSRSEISITDNLAAPISTGEIIGSFAYTAQNGEVITASLIASRDVAVQPDPITIYDVFPFLHIFDNMLVRLLIIVLLLLVLALILHGRAKRRRIERRRRELYERRRREYQRRQREASAKSRNTSSRTTTSRQTAVRTSNTRKTSGSTRPTPSTRIPARTTPPPKRRSSTVVPRHNRNDDDLFGNF